MHGVAALGWSLWVTWRAPLVALAASLLATVSARALRVGLVGAAAAGVGAVAGFYALAGFTWPAPGMTQRLAPVAVLATAAAVLAGRRGVARGGPAAGGLTAGGLVAVLGGWLLIGAPLHVWPVLRWVEVAGTAAVLAVGALGLGGLGAGPVLLASLSLACGLSAAHAAHAWILAALVPGGALAGSLTAPGRLVQPAGVAVAAVAAACVLATGDLQRLTLRPTEAAVLAPVLAVWLAGRLAPRLHLAASGIGLAAATLAVWMIAGGR